MAFVIEEINAFIATDKDGVEGVVAFFDQRTGIMTPLVCADPARVESMRPVAERIARSSGQKVSLVRFSVREVVEEEI